MVSSPHSDKDLENRLRVLRQGVSLWLDSIEESLRAGAPPGRPLDDLFCLREALQVCWTTMDALLTRNGQHRAEIQAESDGRPGRR